VVALILMLQACASATPQNTYSKRFDACLHRLAHDQPDLTDAARNKSCTTEVGPPPFDAPTGLVPAPVR
jgi:hypothetical protein